MQKVTGEELSREDKTKLVKNCVLYDTIKATHFIYTKWSDFDAKCVVDKNGKRHEIEFCRWPFTHSYNEFIGTLAIFETDIPETIKETETKKEQIKMTSPQMTPNKTNPVTPVQQAYATVKSDGVEAAWRTAARQAVKSTKAPLLAYLKNQSSLPSSVVSFLGGALDTENGEAVLAFVLGTVITYVPQLGTDPRFVRLAKELRVAGIDTVFSKVADVVLNPLREQLVDIIKGVPFEVPAGGGTVSPPVSF